MARSISLGLPGLIGYSHSSLTGRSGILESPLDFKKLLNSTRELARSNSVTAGEELVMGFKVPSDLQEIRTLVELGLHVFIVLFSIST